MHPAITLAIEQSLASPAILARALSAADRHALDERGYLIVPGVIDAAEIERLSAVFDHVCELEGISPRGTRHPKGLLDSDPAFGKFLTHPTLLAAAWQILGRPFRAGAPVGRDPMPGFGQQGLHADCLQTRPGTPFSVVTALGLIDDFTEQNGATRMVPGSHHFRRQVPKTVADPNRRHPDQVIITAPAGSILVFNGHLWHSGTCNRSDGHRRALQYSFAV